MSQPTTFEEAQAKLTAFNRRVGIAALVLVATVLFVVAGCQIRNSTSAGQEVKPSSSESTQPLNVYDKVAMLDAFDAEREATPEDYAQTRDAMIALEVRCIGSAAEIGDAVEVAHQDLSANGFAESRRYILRLVSGSIPSEQFGLHPCVDLIEHYVLIRKKAA